MLAGLVSAPEISVEVVATLSEASGAETLKEALSEVVVLKP